MSLLFSYFMGESPKLYADSPLQYWDDLQEDEEVSDDPLRQWTDIEDIPAETVPVTAEQEAQLYWEAVNQPKIAAKARKKEQLDLARQINNAARTELWEEHKAFLAEMTERIRASRTIKHLAVLDGWCTQHDRWLTQRLGLDKRGEQVQSWKALYYEFVRALERIEREQHARARLLVMRRVKAERKEAIAR